MPLIRHHHYILYKPYGYLSQFVNNQNKRKNKKLLTELGSFPQGTMAIGRLDETSEGLLLLTTDGKISEHIRSSSVPKEYYAQLDGKITEEAILQLCDGLAITVNGKPYMTQPCHAQLLTHTPDLPPASAKIRAGRHRPTSWISITLTEGKYRQVRKMTAKVGFPTLRLVRMRIGDILLGKMEPGQVAKLELPDTSITNNM